MARIVPELPVPLLFQFGYTADELLLLIVLSIGAGVGARKRLPLWSYTWVVLMITSLATFLYALIPVLTLDVAGVRSITVGQLVAMTHLATRLTAGLVVLVFAASRATQGLRYAFFVAAIYLSANATSPYIREASTNVSFIELAVANTVAVLIAAIFLAVVVSMVMRFLYGEEGTQRRSVYILIAVALVEPILTGLVLALGSVGTGAIVNVAGIFGTLQLARWMYVGVALLITWLLALLFIRIGKEGISSPVSSGEVNG